MKKSALFLSLILTGASLFAAEWKPVEPSELAQKTPRVDTNADAEAIFWDVHVEDRLPGGQELSLQMTHYIRIKIFTEKGKEEFTTVEIPRYGKRRIVDVAGRTIKANGSIAELKKDAIFDRELVKAKSLKVHGISFALPNVEVGDIVEYRYREIRDGEISNDLRLYFQREIPLWLVTYHVKPLKLDWLPYTMRMMGFQAQNTPPLKEPDGFFATSSTNVPAFHEEPDMPPEDALRSWVLIFYEEDKKIELVRFWKDLGKDDFARIKPFIKVDNAVQRLTAELTSGTATSEEKLGALDKYCRIKIRNLSSSAQHLTAEQRKNVKENANPGDTIRQGAGTGRDVNYLFTALAIASGFDARMARIADRGDAFFSPTLPTTYFLNKFSVAVKVGDKWTFFDPSTPYIEPGMLRWQEEGTQALLSDPKEGFFIETPFSQPARSVRGRKAELKLNPDGSLQGTVTYTYTGHSARAKRDQYEDMTPAQVEQDWKDAVQGRLSGVEMSQFASKETGESVMPAEISFHVDVPGYATVTGKRILFQPAFFQRNVAPRYTESKRHWSLYFDYGWTEEDQVTIELPPGWEPDQPGSPGSSKFGPVGFYQARLTTNAAGNSIAYQRHFDWGRDKNILLGAEAYAQVKAAFDYVQQQDNFTIALRQGSGSAK